MAFNINAQVILTGPKNIKTVTSQIQQQLQGINANVNVTVPKKAGQQLNQLNQGMNKAGASTKKLNQQSLQSVQSLNRMGGAARNAGGAMHMLGKETALTFKRFAAAGIVTATFFRLTSAISEAIPKALEFQREMVRLQQVTGKSAVEVSRIGNATRKLSKTLGVDANDLANVARIFAQAGQTIKQVQSSLDAVAKSSLAPTFGAMEQTAEGLIAALNQFNIAASESEAVLGAINRVSKKFAVESGDIIAAIRRAGGVFAISAGQFTEPIEALEQFIAVFTSVRSTTRESAETIATGLRTIFTRMQRKDTIEALRDLGIELVDTEGKFVGMYEAFRRISVELEKVIQQGDALTLSGITEELGGIRQMGKLVPAIKNFAKAQAALNEAKKGAAEGLGPDVAKGLTPLIKQFEMLQARFSDFIRSIAESSTFNTMAKAAIGLANAFMKIGEVLTPLLPMISAIMISKGTQMFGGFMSGFMGGFGKGPGMGASIGQAAGGSGSASSQAQTTIMNTVSTKLQTLISGDQNRFTQLQTIATEITTLQSTLVASLNNLNLSIRNMRGRGMASGGLVPGSGSGDTVPAMLTPGEFVIRKSAVGAFGAGNLGDINRYKAGGMIVKKTDDSKFDGIFARPRGADTSGKRISAALNKTEDGQQIVAITGAPKSILTSGADEVGFEQYAEKGLRIAISGMSKKMASKSLKRGPIANAIIAEIDAKDIAGKIFEGMVKVVTGSFGQQGTEGASKTWDIPKGTISKTSSDQPAITKLFGPISNEIDHDAKLSENRGARTSLLMKALASNYVSDIQLAKFTGTYGDKTNAWLKGMPRGPKKNAAILERIEGIKKAKTGVGKLVDEETAILLKDRLQRMQNDLQKSIPATASKTRKKKPMAAGGAISGSDTVPALLTPGEFVINKASAQSYGYGNLKNINKYAAGGRVQKFAGGDQVQATADKSQMAAIGSGNLQLAIGNLAGGMTGMVSTLSMMKDQGLSFATALNLATSAAMLFTAIKAIPFGAMKEGFKGLAGKFGAAGRAMAPGPRFKTPSQFLGTGGGKIPIAGRTILSGKAGLKQGLMGGLSNQFKRLTAPLKKLGTLFPSLAASTGTAAAGSMTMGAALSAAAAPIGAFVAAVLVAVAIFYVLKTAGDFLIDSWFDLGKKTESWASTEDNKIEGRKGVTAGEAGAAGAAKGAMTGAAVGLAVVAAFPAAWPAAIGAALIATIIGVVRGGNIEAARQAEFLAYERLGKAADRAAEALQRLADDKHITGEELVTESANYRGSIRGTHQAGWATGEKTVAESWATTLTGPERTMESTMKDKYQAERTENLQDPFSIKAVKHSLKSVFIDPWQWLPRMEDSPAEKFGEGRAQQAAVAQAELGSKGFVSSYTAMQEKTGEEDLGAAKFGNMVDKAFDQSIGRVDTSFLKEAVLNIDNMALAMEEAGISSEQMKFALTAEREAKLANIAATAAAGGSTEGKALASAYQILAHEAGKTGKSVADLSYDQAKAILITEGYGEANGQLNAVMNSGVASLVQNNMELKKEQAERQKTTFLMTKLTRAANIANQAVDIFVSGMGRLSEGIKEASDKLAMDLGIMKNMFKDAGKSVQSFRPQLNVFKNLETSSNEQIGLATAGVLGQAGLGGEAERVSATVQLSKALPDIFRKASMDLALTPELETPQQIFDALGNVASEMGFDNWDKLPDAIKEQLKTQISTIQTRQGGKINIEELFKTMLSSEEFGKLNEAMSKASTAVTKSMAEVQDALFKAQAAYVTVLQQEVAIVQAGIKARTSEYNIIKKVDDALAQFEPNKGKFTRNQMAQQQAQRQQKIFGPGATTDIDAQSAKVSNLYAENERLRNNLAASGGAVMGNVSEDSIKKGQEARANTPFGRQATIDADQQALNENTKALENEKEALKALIGATDKLTGIQNELAARARDRMTAREITQRDTKMMAEAGMIKDPVEREKFLEENTRSARAFQKFQAGEQLDPREFVALGQGVEEAIKLARAGGVSDGAGGIRQFTDEDEAELRKRYADFQAREFDNLNQNAGRDLPGGRVFVDGNLAQRQRAANLAATTTTAEEEKLKEDAKDEAVKKAKAQKMLDDIGITAMKDGLELANKALVTFQTQVANAGAKLQSAITDMDKMAEEAREIRESAQTALAEEGRRDTSEDLKRLAAEQKKAAIDAAIAAGQRGDDNIFGTADDVPGFDIGSEPWDSAGGRLMNQADIVWQQEAANKILDDALAGGKINQAQRDKAQNSGIPGFNALMSTNTEFKKFADEALKPGSIYTHDQHLEKILIRMERSLTGRGAGAGAGPTAAELARIREMPRRDFGDDYKEGGIMGGPSKGMQEFKSMIETLNKVADGLTISVSMAPMEIILNTGGFTDQMQNIVTKLALDSMGKQLPAMIEARKADVLRALGMENA